MTSFQAIASVAPVTLTLFCVWDRVLRVSFSSKELLLTQLIMSSSDSSYDSSSDSEAAEVEYDLEVEGSSNNNNNTT